MNSRVARRNRDTQTARREAVAAACCYVAITLALFRSLLPVIGTQVYADLGDNVLNTAILAWNAKVIPLTSAWWNFPSFAPLPGVTAWTEHLLGAYPLTSPIIWITGNAVLAYNSLMLVCFALNATCAFLLIREVTGSSIAAFVGGLAFAFAPYQAEHVSHVQVLMAFGMPLALYGLHSYRRARTRTALVWFAVGWFSVLLSNAYMIVFFPILLTLWCVWFLRGDESRAWVRILRVAIVTSLPVVPLLWGYYVRQAAYGFVRGYPEIRSMSAHVTGLMGISHRAVLWKGLLPDTFDEGALFPGLTISILTVIAIVARFYGTSTRGVRAAWSRHDAVIFYFGAAIAMWLLALGPEPTWSGVRTFAYGPYWLLLQLPAGNSIRVPARAWLPAVLCLAVCAGYGASWLAARDRGSWVILPIAIAIVSEGWFHDRTHEVPAPVLSGLIPAGAMVLDLPLYETFENAGPEYLAVLKGYRVVNGYSGYAPVHFDRLRDALAGHRPEALSAFRQLGDLYVLVRPAVDRPFLEWLEAQDGIKFLSASGDSRIYRLPRSSTGPATPTPLPLPRVGRAGFIIQ
jgi:hypothetical protein